MPQTERVIRINHGEAIIVVAASPIFLSPEQQERRQDVLEFAATSIQRSAEDLRYSLSGRVDDHERVRTELGGDFNFLTHKLAEFDITRDELSRALYLALVSANTDAFTKKQIVRRWFEEFGGFLENLPKGNGSIQHEAA